MREEKIACLSKPRTRSDYVLSTNQAGLILGCLLTKSTSANSAGRPHQTPERCCLRSRSQTRLEFLAREPGNSRRSWRPMWSEQSPRRRDGRWHPRTHRGPAGVVMLYARGQGSRCCRNSPAAGGTTGATRSSTRALEVGGTTGSTQVPP
jgi:hypothetical protein